jgi:hypothetical protein
MWVIITSRQFTYVRKIRKFVNVPPESETGSEMADTLQLNYQSTSIPKSHLEGLEIAAEKWRCLLEICA